VNIRERPLDWPRGSLFLRLLKLAILLSAVSFTSRQLSVSSWNAGGVTILWPTNGLLLGVLLCNPKQRWRAYVAVGFAIDFLLNLTLKAPLGICAYQSACNMTEVLVAAFLLYPTMTPKPDLTQRKQFIAFLGYAVLLASAVASLAAAFAPEAQWTLPTWHTFHFWFSADALGIATVTPLYLAFLERRPFGGRSSAEVLGCFALLSITTFGVFWQRGLPLLFVLMPLLLLLGVRLGLAGSALGLMLVAVIGGFLTTAGRGPVALMASASISKRDLLLQAFLATAMLMVYLIELLIAESKHLQANLQVSERRFRMLAEASSDVIVLTDLAGRRSYVSPAAQEVLGWKPQQLLGGNFRELVHAEDVVAMERLFAGCEEGLPTRPLEYRCRQVDGSYVWLEINPRLYHDPDSGKAAGFVNVIRDISRRKREEEEQQRVFETVEHLALSDGLTGIANRRQFDMMLEREWLRGVREQTNLSLLLIDVDRFKAYNDVYGHPSGDECLRQVVATVKPLVNRPADLLARYGGEEFAVILPNTEARGACQMAERIRKAVEERRLSHPGNPPHSVVTLSVGCAASIPRRDASHLELLEAADRALYKAKSEGRNCVHLAEGFIDQGPALASI